MTRDRAGHIENALNLHLEFGHWHHAETEQGKIRLRGALYASSGTPDRGVDFRTFISSPIDEILQVLRTSSGFFSLVIERHDEVIAAVDPIRSIPLFYAEDKPQLLVSDNAEWIRQRCSVKSPYPLGHAEFLLAGYVTGQRTLFEQIKQLRAGELAIFRKSGTQTRRYFVFDHEEPDTWTHEALEDTLQNVSISIFRRLINYANGRQIAVPLSGGYDSRFVLSMLKKLGYENVLCFSYGILGNSESALSKYIASSLGYKWKFVEYTDQKWRDAWSSQEASAFRLMASGHSSLAHIQDWLAIHSLVQQRALDEHCIIVPGHTGDFIAGGHIPALAFGGRSLSRDDLLDSIMGQHLSNAPAPSATILAEVRENLDRAIGATRVGSPVEFASAFERWEWEERQAKYIGNSVRVYDFYGLDWWMPLWDLEFMRYWREVPLDLRAGRKWFISFIQQQYSTLAGSAGSPLGNAASKSPSGFRAIIKQMLPARMRQLIRARTVSTALERHPLCFGALVPRNRAADLTRGDYKLIGMYSRLHLDGDWGKR